MVTKSQLSAYREAHTAIERAVEADLRALWNAIDDLPLEEMKLALVNGIPDIIDTYGRLGQVVAAEWFETLIGTNAFVPDLYSRDAWEASTRWAISPLFDESKTDASAFSFLVQSAQRHALNHSRYTISENVARHKDMRYARALAGRNPCNFCKVLSSRGPVYGPKTAVVAKDGDSYHDSCSCIAVPMRGVWVPDSNAPSGLRWEGDKIAGYDFDELYERDYKPYWAPGDTAADVVRKMRAANPGSH